MEDIIWWRTATISAMFTCLFGFLGFVIFGIGEMVIATGIMAIPCLIFYQYLTLKLNPKNRKGRDTDE